MKQPKQGNVVYIPKEDLIAIVTVKCPSRKGHYHCEWQGIKYLDWWCYLPSELVLLSNEL